MVKKPGKHHGQSKQCQDLCCKVRDRAQSIAFRLYTMHELRNKNVSIGKFLSKE